MYLGMLSAQLLGRLLLPEIRKHKELMKPCVNYALCLGAILKMYPGMLSAQLLGRLLPEIEKSSNIRDFSLLVLKNNSHKCLLYMYMKYASKTILNRCDM
jgi:hypothetical protein